METSRGPGTAEFPFPGATPLLRVVKGDPTPAELAALIAVLAARSGAGKVAAPTPRAGGWADRAAGLRRPLSPGSGGWLAAGRVPGVRTRAGM